MSRIAPYAKALIAALVAGLSVIGAALAESDALTAQDWISAALAFLVALGAVYRVPNASLPEG